MHQSSASKPPKFSVGEVVACSPRLRAKLLNFRRLLLKASSCEAWKGGLSSDEESRMPEWLADLSLFATAEPEEQDVDWEAIIAYETDWRTILAKTTHEAIQNFVPDWRVDLRHATRLSLKERIASLLR